jgi:hypothetical protein
LNPLTAGVTESVVISLKVSTGPFGSIYRCHRQQVRT